MLRSTIRLVLLLLAVQWLAAGTAARVHGLRTRHVACPEHQRIEERSGVVRPASTLAGLFHREVEFGHHGCILQPGLSQGLAPHVGPCVPAGPAAAPSPPGLPLREGHAPPPLQRAPKTSPPRA